MKSTIRSLVFALIVLVFSGPAHAIGVDPDFSCPGDESFFRCLQLAYDDARTRADLAEKEIFSGLVAAETADKAASPDGGGSAAALRDSLAAFVTGLGLGDISEGDEEESLLFRLNPNLLKLGPSNKLGLEVLMRKPELFAPLVMAFSEDQRTSEAAGLEEELEDFDDTEIIFGWSAENERFGRRFQPHTTFLSAVYSNLRDRTKTAVGRDPELDPNALLEELTRDMGPGGAFAPLTPGDLVGEAREKHPELAERAERLVIRMGVSLVRELVTENELAQVTGFDLLPNLLNNQPQLSVSGFYRSRQELAGPDRWGLKGSWEFGWVNLNGLRRWRARQQESDGGAATSLADLGAFIASKGGPAMLEYAPRFAVKLKYQETDPYDISLEDGTVTLDLDRATSWFVSGTVGSYLRIAEDDTQTGRWDLEAEYEDVSDDPNRDSRLVATLTLTQTLADGTDGHVSLVWASKPEYLGEVDEEFSARVGLKYGIDRKEK